MRFTTLTFFIFFAAVYILYWSLKGRSRLYLLLFASIVFYAAWSLFFALHFLLMVLFNFLMVRMIYDRPGNNKGILTVTLVVDFANLFFFKYFYLFLQSLLDTTGVSFFQKANFNGWLFDTIGVDSIVLPLAISFYTFQIVAYVVDAYRGSVEDRPAFIEFFIFILFFPQLVAGPIMRHTEFLPALKNIQPSESAITAGVYFLIIGLIKKVVIADNMYPVLVDVFASPDDYDWFSNFIAPFGFGARVYADFSGYSDIARGLGFMLGLSLPENFKGPFLSTSLRELWRRWHITLSSWLRDYLYIPLGGSRTGEARSSFNLITTFTLGGLWHGASYTFIAWGFIHGLFLVIERYVSDFYQKWRGPRKEPENPNSLLHRAGNGATAAIGTVYAFFIFGISIIFFNAPDIAHSFTMIQKIVTGASGKISVHNEYILNMIAVVFVFNIIEKYGKRPSWNRTATYGALFAFAMLATYLMGRFAPGGADFIYFQF